MKIVLSRKGFDSSYGGVPSPILLDGTLLSMPIPHRDPPLQYGDLTYRGHTFATIVEHLADPGFNRKFRRYVHLDPDIRRNLRLRKPGWKPLFGQAGRARQHLRNNGVGKNDLFLFFGQLKKIQIANGHYSYVTGAPDIHVMFGWMQVGRVYDLSDRIKLPQRAKDFPHYNGSNGTTVYAAKNTSPEGPSKKNARRWGIRQYRDILQLTEHGKSRSIWRLPRWFYPFNLERSRKPLSYHKKRDRWERLKAHVRLHTVAKGQEFIFDTADYPEAFSLAETTI